MATIQQMTVISDLRAWKVDPAAIAEVEAAFVAGDMARAMELASDLGYVRRDITIVIDGRTAYNCGFSKVDGLDFRNFVACGPEADLLAAVAYFYPSETHNVTIVHMAHRAWLKAAKAARS